MTQTPGEIMSENRCNHCGFEVKSELEKCPYCGSPLAQEKEGGTPKRFLVFFVLVVLLCLVTILVFPR